MPELAAEKGLPAVAAPFSTRSQRCLEAEFLLSGGEEAAPLIHVAGAVLAVRGVEQRPAGYDALGRLLLRTGQYAEAEAAFDTALTGYRASIERGEVDYLHHVADVHSTVRHDDATAAVWRRRDAETLARR